MELERRRLKEQEAEKMRQEQLHNELKLAEMQKEDILWWMQQREEEKAVHDAKHFQEMNKYAGGKRDTEEDYAFGAVSGSSLSGGGRYPSESNLMH